MKGIITVLGKDNLGIIANISNFLTENNINILEISQDIIDGYFNMTMIADISNIDNSFSSIIEQIEELGKSLNVQIKMQRADIFDCMHRI